MSDRCGPGCGIDRFPKGHPETTEADIQGMMADLYICGWGYSHIADFCGRSHDEVRDLLLRNFPARDG